MRTGSPSSSGVRVHRLDFVARRLLVVPSAPVLACLAHVRSGKMTGVTVVDVRGHLVTVEAHVGRGLPSLTLTGLLGAGVQDARDRIEQAKARLEEASGVVANGYLRLGPAGEGRAVESVAPPSVGSGSERD
jgi:hypothetical protein